MHIVGGKHAHHVRQGWTCNGEAAFRPWKRFSCTLQSPYTLGTSKVWDPACCGDSRSSENNDVVPITNLQRTPKFADIESLDTLNTPKTRCPVSPAQKAPVFCPVTRAGHRAPLVPPIVHLFAKQITRRMFEASDNAHNEHIPAPLLNV